MGASANGWGREAGASSGGVRVPPWAAIAAALVPFLLLVWRFDFLTDDAFISFRYARHLAEGHGLVFNVAPDEPLVEGYSNFLWVLVLALGERLGVAAPVLSRVLSVAAGVTLVVLFVRFVARRADRGTTLVAGLALATLPPLAVWSTGGLATMPATLFLFLAFERLFGGEGSRGPRGGGAGLCMAMVILLRADGFVAVGLLLGGALLGLLFVRERGPLLRALLVAGAVAAAVLAAHLAWRQATYGEWLPNTALAKVRVDQLSDELRARFHERGTRYVVSFFLAFLSPCLALALGLWALLRRPRPAQLAAWALVLGVLAYARAVGGDFMAMHRFLVPALPFLVLLFVEGLAAVRPAAARLVLGGAFCVLSLAPAFGREPVPFAVRNRYHFRWNQAEAVGELEMWRSMKRNVEKWTEVARALRLFTEPGERLLRGPIGAVGYHTELYLYDSYGLTNRDLARLPVEVQQLGSPGHDRSLPLRTFLELPLDYAEAAFVERLAPYRSFNARERGLIARGAHPLYEAELHPLDPALGFPEGTSLLLLRWRPRLGGAAPGTDGG